MLGSKRAETTFETGCTCPRCTRRFPMPSAGIGSPETTKPSVWWRPVRPRRFSERPIERNEVIVPARVVGGLPMLDHGEADDKIIAVLTNDPLWSGVTDIAELPEVPTQDAERFEL